MIEFSEIQSIYFILPLIGLIIGLFGTMLGGGGSFFFLPLLTLLFGVPTQTAVITSLVATLPICTIGTLGHFRKSNIDFRIAAMFSITGILGAFLGAVVANIISQKLLKVSFGIYSVLIALNMIYSTWQEKRTEVCGLDTHKKHETKEKVKGSFFGLFAGIITGTFGTSGTAPVLAGLFSMHIPLNLVIGTSLMVVLTNTVFATGAHLLVGNIDLTIVLFLTVGSTIGSLLGPKILSKIETDKPESKVRYLYAIIMAVIGILMITG